MNTEMTSVEAAGVELTGAASEGVAAYRMSPQQRELWARQEATEAAPLVGQCVARVRGALRPDVLASAARAAVAKYEALRTGLVRRAGAKVPAQVIRERGDAEWREQDLRRLEARERAGRVEEVCAEESARPFDLEQGPVLRLALLTLADVEHVLVLTLPTVWGDTRTLLNLVRELSETCAARPHESADADEPLQYVDLCEWQNELQEGEEAEEGRRFWREHLAAAPSSLRLPLSFVHASTTSYFPDSARHAEAGAEGRAGAQGFVDVGLDPDSAALLTDTVARLGVTRDALLRACWQAVMSRLTGREELVVAVLCDGRQYEQLSGAVGLFARYLPSASGAASGRTLAEVAREAAALAESAADWQDYFRGEDVLSSDAWSPALGYSFESWAAAGAPAPGWEVERVRVGLARCALALRVSERAEGLLSAEVEYDTRGDYTAGDAERVAQYLSRVLRQTCESAGALTVAELELAGEAEREQLVNGWNETLEEYEHGGVVEMFERAVAAGGGRVAVECEGRGLSYEELNARANRLAHFLRRRGVGPDVKVALFVERSEQMIVGLLAVLKAGGAYVPLNVEYPKERLAEQLADTQSPVVLTQQTLLERLPRGAAEVVCLDRDREAWAGETSTNPRPAAGPENLAYVIFTSGSTGQPKGVAVTRRNIANYAAFICRKLGLDEETGRGGLSFATVSTLAADLGNTAVFPALLSGGRLHVISYEVATNSTLFADYMMRHAVDVLKVVPSHLSALISSKEAGSVLPRRFLILGGEALSYDLVRRVREEAGGCRVINHYGPTETTVGVLTHSLEDVTDGTFTSATVPIGRPIANARAYVLDARLSPVPAGVAGELYVGGRGVARGYLNRPALTAERFIPDPFSGGEGSRLYRTGDVVRRLPGGDVEFLGREDGQVKIRGFRIETGEIEAALRTHASVKEAVVLARDDEQGHKRLVAYVVAPRGTGVAELQDYLKRKLPDYMIPSAFAMLDAMPLNRNGKIDRRALPAPSPAGVRAAEASAEPTTPTEQQLARIWEQVLGVERVYVNDNFFELGGDSIISIQIIARANKVGLRLTPKMLFQYQTVAELAAVATREAPAQAEQGEVEGALPLTPAQLRFFEQELSEPHHWNQALLLETREELKAELLEGAVRALVVHHDALRLRFTRTPEGWRQVNAAAEQSPIFSRVDLSSLGEAEQSRAVEARAAEAQAGLNINAGPLLRVVQFDLGAGRQGRLLVVIHHLAVDGLSWRILLEDLRAAYEQLERGESVELPPKTTSFKRWAEQLAAHAQSASPGGELDYWLAEVGRARARLPVDYPGAENTVASAQVVTAELDDEETRALLQRVPAAYRTQINDVLLTALVQSFARWTGSPSLLVELEGHGREELGEEADLSRTVGWFTTNFPVALDLTGADGPGQALKAVKEHLRGVPARGIGYGLLRYFRAEGAVLGDAPQPEVSFNYLGQLDQTLPEDSPFTSAKESAGPVRSEKARRTRLLEIVGCVAGGRLRISLTYSRQVHRRETVAALAEGYVAALRSLIAHCTSPGAGGHTPSDFPLARLGQRQLDELLAGSPPVEDIYPLSPVQQGLLFHSLYEPEAGLYFEQKTFVLRGRLDVAAFRRACQRMADRHAILRTAFAWRGLDEPLQVVSRQAEVPWTVEDWRGLTADEQRARLQAFLKADRALYFDPSAAPLMRMAMLRMADDLYHFVWSHHHLLLDGWTLPLLFVEVAALYRAFRRGEDLRIPLPPPYRNYIEWLGRQDLSAAESFWRRTLKGVNAPTSLTPSHPARAEAPHGDIYSELEMAFPADDSETLRAVARQSQLTPSTVLQGAWALVLSHHSGKRDVIFGAPVSGRPAGLDGVEFMVGLFINTLPVRARVEPSESFLSWLKSLQAQQVEMRQFEHSPLVQVQQWSEVPRELPLFECILVFDNYPINNSLLPADASAGDERDESFEVEEFRAFEKTNYPMLIQSGLAAQLTFRILYDRRLFDAAAVGLILKHVEALLKAFAERPEAPVSELMERLKTIDREHQAVAQQKRQEAKFKKFGKVTPKALDLRHEGSAGAQAAGE
jgi:amino acid adenylation domain-containing protein/non-ribosomal peptide synthase protein (TIGR01720 family)